MNSSEPSTKERAVAVLRALETGDPTAVEQYVSAETYIQHNLAFPDGREAILAALPALEQAGTTVRPVRVLGDGAYVAVHSAYRLSGKDQVGFDIFRFDRGRIVEHWDNLQETADRSRNGHGQIDGPTGIADLERTSENKALVREFADSVLLGRHPERLPSFFDGDAYIQHNPLVADGVSGLTTALRDFAAQGTALRYDRTRMVLGEGNFVLAASEGALGPQPVTYYDLFRVENGKLAEHWDVIEPVMPEGEWKNRNGKF